MPTSSQWVRRLEILANASTVLIAVVLAWMVFHSPRVPAQSLSLNGAHARGGQAAKVGMIIFADFQCPACRRFVQAVFPALVQQYVEPGHLVVGFRHFPIAAVHPLAVGAAEAAQCAEKQGRLWPVHDFLFEHPDSMDIDLLTAKSLEIGVNAATFAACVISKEVKEEVQADLRLGKEIGVQGTPTVFLGEVLADRSGRSIRVRNILRGSQPLEAYRAAIDTALGRE
jgi:protein-disulfide isomerase